MTKAMISGRSPSKPPAGTPIAPITTSHADELQRDIGHGRDDAGERHGQREPAVAEPPAHEIRRRDVAVLVRHRPQPGENHVEDRVDHDRVRHGEEADAPAPNTSAGTAMKV